MRSNWRRIVHLVERLGASIAPSTASAGARHNRPGSARPRDRFFGGGGGGKLAVLHTLKRKPRPGKGILNTGKVLCVHNCARPTRPRLSLREFARNGLQPAVPPPMAY